jgi:uncharacterized membrane protein
MNGKFQLATWLLWLALPITALDYGMVWNDLPGRMAVHFDVNWRANGWASREAALQLGMGVVLFMLIVFTIASYVLRGKPVPNGVAWSLLAFFYATVVFVCAVNHWVVRYNVRERAMRPYSVYVGSMPRGDLASWRYPELHS